MEKVKVSGKLNFYITIFVLLIMISFIGRLNRDQKGALIIEVSASPALNKSVGDNFYFKCTIKNTGDVRATFGFAALWREHGTTSWTGGPFVTVTLDPRQTSGTITLTKKTTSGMAGKTFDAGFRATSSDGTVTYDEKVISEAFYVKMVTSASIIDYWVE